MRRPRDARNLPSSSDVPTGNSSIRQLCRRTAQSPSSAATDGWALPAPGRYGLRLITLVILWAVLVSPRHRASRIALSVSDIEINAVAPARYGTPISIPASSRSLILRRDHAVRITTAPNIHIVAVPALLNLHPTGYARQRQAKMSGDCCSCDGKDHTSDSLNFLNAV
jgi:hypothetical protein